MQRISFIICFFVLLNACSKKEGCTDPSATNFDPLAMSNDGSCIYANNPGVVSSIVNYTTLDGLLDNFVECITVDINNNIWIGTSIGVQKFDGTTWTTYNTSNTIGLVNDNIKVISAMDNGDIWVGTDFGASKFDGTNWNIYNSSNGLNSNQIKAIDKSLIADHVWIGTATGVSYYDGEWGSIGSPDLHWSGVASVAHTFNSHWFAHPLGGVTNHDASNNIFDVYDTANGLISQNVTDLIIDSQGNKWIGTGGGISVLNIDNTAFTHYTRMYLMPPPDTLNPVVEIAIDNWDRVWAAIYVGYLAEGGVACWNGLEWVDYDVSDGLAGPNIKGIAVDLDDNIWVATTTGISKMIIGLD